MLTVTCIPAYNEEQTIVDVIKRASKYVDKVIVCDDGSEDNTSRKAEDAGAIIIKHDKNLGKGASFKSLFKVAKELNAEIIVTIDGDGQFLPEEIPKLMKPIIENRADVVIGYRFTDINQVPYYRKVGNKVLDKLTNIASELPFRDSQSGFRAYSKRAIELVRFHSDGFSVDSEILIDAAKKGLRISEEHVTVLYKTKGKTSTKNPIVHSAGVVASLIELIAVKHPLKYLGIPGLILLSVGIFYSINVMIEFNDTRYFSVPTTLIAIGSLLTGLMIFLMAILLFAIRTRK